MLKPLFGSLFAVWLTIPGCRDTSSPPVPVPTGPRFGQVVPEIEATDLEGETFKLSDYRGKVVALSYWAEWCPFCVKLFPHEKALVERFRDEPFVLLGVNGDESREDAKATQDRHKLPWRSFWAGGRRGAIPTAWGVEGWPTTYVIDAKGVLRFKFEGAQPEAVERAVERLLREMDKAS